MSHIHNDQAPAWNADNIDPRDMVPIDFHAYQRLKTTIAKALVPHLTVWFHATQHLPRYRKRYADLCQTLGIRQYRYQPRIRTQLSREFEALRDCGYLLDWSLERGDGRQGYIISLLPPDKHLTGISILPADSGPLYTNTPLRTPDFFIAHCSAPS